MNIRPAKFFAILSLSLLLSAAVYAQNGWNGRYEFDEDGGRTVGGTAIFISHELVISGDSATLKSNGYQTSKDLICRVKHIADGVEIYFESYGEDNVIEAYKKGDLLLTLKEKKSGKRRSIITNWAAFQPVTEEKPRSGKIYFKRSSTSAN